MEDIKQVNDIGLFFIKVAGTESVAKKDKEMSLEEHSELEPNPGERAKQF